MFNFINRFVGIVKSTGKYAALLAVIITILSFAAEELDRWSKMHTEPESKKKVDNSKPGEAIEETQGSDLETVTTD
jgi:hypothetical protein